MARKRANLSDLLNDLTFKVLFNKYKLIAMNAFQWEGLPEGIQERHIERELFNHGKCVFFRDDVMDFMALECQETGKLNTYGDPLQYIAVGHNYHKTYWADNCVIVENNKLKLATKDFLLFYVNKLTEAERTMDVNIKACKTPVVFACDDKDVLTFKRIFQQVDGNVPAIFADRGLNLDSIQSFQTGVKFMGNDLMDYSQSVENKLLTFLGINNPAVDKKERLITDEANSNNQLIDSFGELQLEARKRACDEINEMYGLNVSVKRREPDIKTVDSVEGGVDNVSV